MSNDEADPVNVISPLPWAPLTGATRDVAMEVLMRGPLSRSELARRLELSPASLTRLTKPLLEGGLLVEAQTPSPGRAGRPSRPLDIVPDTHHIVGVNLTGETATGVITTLRAEIVASMQVPLPDRQPAAVVDTIRDLTTALSKQIPDMSGLGVSLGGHVRDHQIVTRAPFLRWTSEVPLAAMLEGALEAPAVVDNDLIALTRAEDWFGVGRECDHFAVITIGASVGYGLVVHNQIVDSPDAGVGLVGHYPLDPLGPPCADGHRGCASAMLSIPSITYAVSAGLARDVDYDGCLDLAEGGDPVAGSIVGDAGRALGRLIAAVANLTMAKKILITGEGSRLADVANDAIHDGIQRDRDPRASQVEFEIQPVDFRNYARGAAVAAIQAFAFGT